MYSLINIYPEALPFLVEMEKLIYENPWSLEDYAAFLSWHKNYVYLAESDGSVCGYVCIVREHEFVQITSIGIIPDFHRMGCGRFILTELAKKMKHSRRRVIAASVMESDHRAAKFFSGVGFHYSRTDDGYLFSQNIWTNPASRIKGFYDQISNPRT